MATLKASDPLEAVCLKAMALRPADRYASPRVLADDIEHVLADEPVAAYREPLWGRLTRWGRRHRTLVTTAAALLVAAAVALAVGLVAVDAEKVKTKEALDAKTAALEQSEKAEESARAQRQLALKTVRDVVGDINAQLKDRPGQKDLRKALLGRALAGLKEVARAADTATAIDHEAIRAHLEVGGIFLEIEEGGSTEALKQYKRAYEVARKAWEANPESAQAQLDLSAAHQGLGDVYLRLGDRKAALDSYEKGLEISQSLADADKTSAQAQRDLAASHERLGVVYLGLGDRKAALDSYKKGLEISQSLADADKTSALAQRDLFVSHSGLGDLYIVLEESKAALDSYKKGLEISQRLADADKTSAQAQRDLSVSHSGLGKAYQRLGDSKAALEHYQKNREISQRLADADKTSALAQRDLFIGFVNLGSVAQQTFDFKAALGQYGQALEVPKRFPWPEVFKQDVAIVENSVRFCRAVENAVADPATALQQPNDLVLLAAMIALVRKEKQPAKAVAAADLLADNAKGPEDLYGAACGYALCVPLADQPHTKEKYAARAVELLRQAIAKGFKDIDTLKTDTDLDALRQRDDFKKVLADLEAATKPKEKKNP